MNLEEMYNKIYAYCFMLTHHRETAEDLTQQTFYRYLRQSGGRVERQSGGRNDGQGGLALGKSTAGQMAYLYTIARNLATDYYRARARTMGEQENRGSWGEKAAWSGEQTSWRGEPAVWSGEQTSWRGEQAEVRDREAGPEERVVMRMELERALSQISAEDREMVFLRYVNGLSAADVGKIFGISRFAADRRLKRLLKILRKELEKEGWE